MTRLGIVIVVLAAVVMALRFPILPASLFSARLHQAATVVRDMGRPVPRAGVDKPFHFRTWIGRYSVHGNGETTVESISTRAKPPEQAAPEDPTVVRTLFLVRFHRENRISVLKPDLRTEPKVLYAQLDGEVR